MLIFVKFLVISNTTITMSKRSLQMPDLIIANKLNIKTAISGCQINFFISH